MFDLRPANADYFERLLCFAKKIFTFFDAQQIDYVIYGSFALFYYTKNTSLAVNDIDVMVKPEDYPQIISFLKEQNISFKQDGDDFSIQGDDLLIELDGWELGGAHLKTTLESNIVSVYDMNLSFVTLHYLEVIYALAQADPNNTDAEKIHDKITYLEAFLGRSIVKDTDIEE